MPAERKTRGAPGMHVAPGTRKKGRAGRLIFRGLMIVLISVILGGTLYSINARRLLGNAMPMPFGIGASIVLSGSMEPTLSVNDLIVVRASDEYAVGDVIVYQSGSNLIIHRIVRLDGDSIVTQGDANNVEDAPVSPAAVKGRLAFSVPAIGVLVRCMQSTPAALLLVVLIVCLLNRSWRREREADDRELDQIKEEIRRLREAKALPEATNADDRSSSEKS